MTTKFGFVPANITVCTYFSFLNSFCYRPLLLVDMKTRGISFDRPNEYSSRQKIVSHEQALKTGQLHLVY